MAGILEEGPRLVEEDLSRGMFPSVAPERIPAGGAFDITNGLLDEQNVVYRRGGTAYSDQTPRGDPRFLWSGFLRNGQQTLFATDSGFFKSGAPIALTQPSALTRAQVFEGVLYLPGGITYDGSSASTISQKSAFYASAGGRLLAGEGSRISFSQVPTKENEALTWAETDYHQLPGGVQITGMEGFRTSCAVFTTEGIWIIGGLNRELTDAEGNIQQTLDRYSADAVLWGNNGIAGWSAGLVVPCKDNIWFMELGVSSEKAAPFIHIADPIQTTYREYVAAGYKPGVAAVHRGHYFLPILNGSSVVDLFVCRLDATNGKGRTFPWTHLSGSGALLPALAVTDEDSSLLGATAGLGRLLSLNYFEPSTVNGNDADGTTHQLSVTYRDILTGNLVPNLVAKLRLSYRMVATPEAAIVLYFGSTPYGAEWDEFDWDEAEWTEATGPFAELEGHAKADPEALHPYTWRVGRKVRFARVKATTTGSGIGSVSLRSLELFTRSDGRVM